MSAAPRALVLVDVSLLDHPLYAPGELLEALRTYGRGDAVIAALAPDAGFDVESLGIGAYMYPAHGSAESRTRKVVADVHRTHAYDALVIAAWWVDEPTLARVCPHIPMTFEAFRLLDALPPEHLAKALLGAALHAQEVLF